MLVREPLHGGVIHRLVCPRIRVSNRSRGTFPKVRTEFRKTGGGWPGYNSASKYTTRQLEAAPRGGLISYSMKFQWLAFALVIVAGAVVRSWGLGEASLWLDEAASVQFAGLPWSTLWLTGYDNAPPLCYSVLKGAGWNLRAYRNFEGGLTARFACTRSGCFLPGQGSALPQDFTAPLLGPTPQ